MCAMKPSGHDNFHMEYDRYLNAMNIARPGGPGIETTRIPAAFGEGSFMRAKLRPGMELIVADCTLLHSRTLQFESSLPMIELSFWLKGQSEFNLQSEQFYVRDNHCQLAFMKHIEAEMSYTANQPVLACEIRMVESVFRDLIEPFADGTPIDLQQILGSASLRLFRQEIQPTKQLLVRQMLDCPYAPPLQRMYMEGKALELLAFYFQTFLFDDSRSAGRRVKGMRRTDLDKIRAAAELLVARMEQPPSLLELSRLVGISDFKLKAGFRELYDTTVFGYLRDKRMERAAYLIETERFSVYEAAVATGYSNPSHFAAAFREKYGYNPGKWQK